MSYQNLSNFQRLNRILLGAALILATMFIGVTPLGWFAVLPLLATYPLFAGIYGYDPVVDIYRQGIRSVSHAITHIQVSSHRSKHV